MQPLYLRVGGLDVHRMKHVATVLIEQADGSVAKETREYGSFKRDLVEGNITTKTGVTGTYAYGSSRPHAVTAAYFTPCRARISPHAGPRFHVMPGRHFTHAGPPVHGRARSMT